MLRRKPLDKPKIQQEVASGVLMEDCFWRGSGDWPRRSQAKPDCPPSTPIRPAVISSAEFAPKAFFLHSFQVNSGSPSEAAAAAKPNPACVFTFGFFSVTRYGMRVAGQRRHPSQRWKASHSRLGVAIPRTFLGIFEHATGPDILTQLSEIM